MVEQNDTQTTYEEANDLIDDDDVTDKEINTEADTMQNSEQIFTIEILLSSWNSLNFYALPRWMQDNDFLHESHRPELPSYAVCFKSIFRLHSQTGNIWTHLLGCIVFLIIAVYFFSRPEHEIEWEDKFVFLPFFIGAIGCMLLSFLFHTLCCHSESTNKFFVKLDYVGISLLIMGSSLPWYYYAFYCHPKKRIFYMLLLSLISLICMYLSMNDKFMSVNFRTYRAVFFVTSASMAAIPAFHLNCIYGFRTIFYDYSVEWLLLTGLTYIVGAVIYACRIPERYFPGYCDIWFQSHQIFHLFVILAAFIHYHGISVLAERKIVNPCEDNSCTLLSFGW